MTMIMTSKRSLLLLLTPVLINLAACSSDSNYDFESSIAQEQAETLAENAPQALFNPDPADPVLPFPNSLFFSDSTDGLLRIPIAPDAVQTLANPQVALNQLDGFSTTAPIVTTVSESLDPATLIVGDTIRIIEVETVQGIAVTGVVGEISDPRLMVANETNGQLALVPTVPLKPKTSYLIALTNGIKGMDGLSLEASFIYEVLKSNNALDNVDLNNLRLATLSHLAALGAAGIPPENVALTWVFKTQSIRDTLMAVKNISEPSSLRVTDSQLNTAAPGIDLGGLADIWEGGLTLPYYQTAVGDDGDPLPALNGFWKNSDGNPPGALGADLMPNHTPEKTGDETVPVLLTLPNANSGFEKPLEGWPVTVFQHGIGGNRTNMLAIADSMAAAGRAVIAIDTPMHGVPADSIFHATNNPLVNHERTFGIDVIINPPEDEDASTESSPPTPGQDMIADPSGQHFFNLQNLANARDNLRQAVADVLVLRASIEGVTDTAGVPLPELLDGINVSFAGHSFGAIFGVTSLSFDTSFSVATLGMPGGGVVQLLANSPRFGPEINAGLAALDIGVGSAEYNQFLVAAQTIVDSGDPINHAAILAQDTSTPLHMIEVIGDRVIPNEIATAPLSGTAPLARLLGLAQIDASSSTGGLVRFTQGTHSSLLDPGTSSESLAVTTEMQQQAAGFARSVGTDLPVANTSIIQALP